jgi:hypothetical protein
MVYYDGKVEGGYIPVPPKNTKALKWEDGNLYLTAMKNARHLKVDARILNQPAEVMVDLGVTGNFMHPEFMMKLGLLGKLKVAPQPITGLNGENLGTLVITTKSGPVPMVVLGHVKQLNFDIVPMGWYDVVLGIPWLRNHNPAIDWSMN